MPRAKVLPENRKRSVQACVPCRSSKVRCDAQQPCQGCKKRDKISECIYDTPYQQSDPRRVSISSRRAAPTPSSNLVTSPRTSSQREEDSTFENGSADESWAQPSHKTHSRLLLSSKGEKLYIGGTASLSYLQFLRHVLKRQMGKSKFTESDSKNFMLEVDPSPHVNEDLGDLDIEHKRALVQCYFEASSAILDIFSKADLEEHLASEALPLYANNGSRGERASKALFHAVLAIGGQCRGIYPSDGKYASRYFAKAQQFAFEGFLCDPSLHMIKLFLLLAFYMLGACRRNAAFMYLGIASKAAHALGLHRKDQYRVLPRDDRSERLRTWKSLCVLDTIVSSILGRPGNFPSIWHDDLESNTTGELELGPTSLAIDASYEMACLIDSMEHRLWNSSSPDSSSAEEYLQKLRGWSQKLPPELRRFSSNNIFISSPADRELLLGAAHVACIYYFAVILVTRPFLTSHIMLKLRDRARKKTRNNEETPAASNERSQIANLAQVCVDSATYMATMTHKAMEAGVLLRNMCLLKAWLFAAGLLLGFSLFAEEGAATETVEALGAVRSVLLNLSELSPLAKHYYDILSNFSDAISKYRQQRKDERRQTTNQFIDQIFTIDLRNTPSQMPYLSPESGSAEMLGPVESLSQDFDFDAAMGLPTFNADDTANFPMLWDDFSADWPPLGTFFEAG